MKNLLFSPSIWRIKFPKSSGVDELAASERSETPTSTFIGRLKPGHKETGGRANSSMKQTPCRPPRPPSPNLFGTPRPVEDTSEVPTFRRELSQKRLIRDQRPTRTADLLKAKRSLPELDGVWKGFLNDVNEDHDSLYQHPIPDLLTLQRQSPTLRPELKDEEVSGSRSHFPRRRPLGGSHPRVTLHTSRSTTCIAIPEEPSLSPRSSVSSADYVTDIDSLALFPAPPPLRIRKKVPKPLILLPTATIVPLPPSPCTGSLNPTPVASPTSPKLPQSPRRATSPPSILKKSQSAVSLYSMPTSPSYNTHPSAAHSISSPSRPSPSISPTSHKSSSSDTMALSNSGSSRRYTNRTNTFASSPRNDQPLPPLTLNGRQRNIKHPSPVEWGIAV
ncbi:hypothetical protein F5876DRAFT_76573 [Lentinula aff. lateritia]|uniref:Uncharacterized protein n=1 Tax=Lentinula aff. lateritia TaxID=2804960 RepID=A0ACC1U0R1_9AGAR|nr:hypothetical protein F5876DRAFT_76573 [Lentinula aff. lateritia]